MLGFHPAASAALHHTHFPDLTLLIAGPAFALAGKTHKVNRWLLNRYFMHFALLYQYKGHIQYHISKNSKENVAGYYLNVFKEFMVFYNDMEV